MSILLDFLDKSPVEILKGNIEQARIKAYTDASVGLFNCGDRNIISIPFEDYCEICKRVTLTDKMQNGEMTKVVTFNLNQTTVTFVKLIITSYVQIFILQWLLPRACIIVTGSDSDSEFYPKEMEIYNRYGLYFTEDRSAPEVSNNMVRDSKYTKAILTLNLHGLDSSDVIQLITDNSLDAKSYGAIYAEITDDKLSIFLEKKNELLRHMISILNLKANKGGSSVFLALKNTYTSKGLKEFQCIKEFLNKSITSTQELVDLISSILYEEKKYDNSLIITFDISYADYDILVLNAIQFVLAYLTVYHNIPIAFSDSENIATTMCEYIRMFSAKPWSTLKGKLELIQELENACSPVYSDVGNVIRQLPICLAYYNSTHWNCVITNCVNNTKLQIVPWEVIKNNLVYSEQDIEEFTPAEDSYGRRVTYYSVETIPIYKQLIDVNDRSKQTSILTIKEALSQYSLLDMFEISDRIPQAFSLEDKKWVYTKFKGTNNSNAPDAFFRTKETSLAEVRKKYAFWESVCRLMEQLVILPDVEGVVRGFTTYISLQDLIFLQDKDGNLYLGFSRPEIELDTILASNDLCFKTKLTELEYLSINSTQDCITGSTVTEIRDINSDKFEIYVNRLMQTLNSTAPDLITQIKENTAQLQVLEYPVYRDSLGYLDEVKADHELYLAIYLFICKNKMWYTLDSNKDPIFEKLTFIEREFADEYNQRWHRALSVLAKEFPPYGGAISQSIVNIFGGLYLSLESNIQRYSFNPGPNHAGAVYIGCKQTIDYPY